MLLHWLLVLALLVSLFTGLRLAADEPGLRWLRALDFLLPQGDVWGLHIAAGLLMIGLAGAYVVYLHQARLSRRVKLDRARLSGLLRRGRARWGALNVLLYWSFFLTFAIQLATGLLLFLGHGGSVTKVHLAAAFFLLAFPLLHVAAHWAYGGWGQVLRILRPVRLDPAVAPQTLAEAFAEHLAREDATLRPDTNPDAAPSHSVPRFRAARAPRLQAHPLVSAAVAGVVVAGFVYAADQADRDTLTINAVAANLAPRLDGDLSDPAWRSAAPVVVRTRNGANFDGAGATRIEARAVHDGKTAYFAFVWDDPTRSLKHLPLVKRPDGWRLLHEQYDIEDEDAYYEDKFAVLLSTRADMPGAGSTHLGPKPLPGKPGGLSGRGLHYTTDGGIVDVWHWKASRGGLLGTMDDNYFGAPAEPTPAEAEGKSRYKGGYLTDPGKAIYSANFKHEAPGGYAGPIQPVRLPKDLAATLTAMGRIDLDPNHGEQDGARWWMTGDETTPYSAGLDARIPVGTVIPGVLIAGEYSGDRADVRCAAHWAGGRWTLEVARRLDTGSTRDIAIASGAFMWVAAFDHSQTRHTRHMRPIRLEVR